MEASRALNDEKSIDVLAAIWQRLFKLTTVDINDNFFELGGEPAQAVELFNEISILYGRQLPAVLIYQMPTLRDLAELLADSSRAPACTPLLRVKPGKADLPIFLAPGIDGDALQLFHLVDNIGAPAPVYVLQASGIDGLSEPIDRIEAMVDQYLPAIKRVQFHGPYLLVGYSLGGLIMLEIAQRLLTQGQEIGLLAMIDSYPHRSHLPLGQQFPLAVRAVVRRIDSLKKQGHRTKAQPQINSTADLTHVRIHSAAVAAWKSYRPRFYSGKINFLRAEVISYFPANVRAVWDHLAGSLEIQTVPGNHSSLVTRNSKNVADALTPLLMDSLPNNGGPKLA